MTVKSQLDASLHFPSAPPDSQCPVAQVVRQGFSHLPLLRRVYLGLHRGQHASRLKANKQCHPPPTPQPNPLPVCPHPGEFMWERLIASVHFIVSIAPRCASQTERKQPSETFPLSLHTSLSFIFYLQLSNSEKIY